MVISKIKKEWYKLGNGYWLKILFIKVNKCVSEKYYCNPNAWLVSIAVGKTKRKVNDHYSKTYKSPKSLYLKSSNVKGGIESLIKTMESLKHFEKSLTKDSMVVIQGFNDQRTKVYSRLLRYGYKKAAWNDESIQDFYYKEI